MLAEERIFAAVHHKIKPEPRRNAEDFRQIQRTQQCIDRAERKSRHADFLNWCKRVMLQKNATAFSI